MLIKNNMEKSTHISQYKKDIVKGLADRMKMKTVMVVSIKKLPSAQFQDIKKKIREHAVIQVAKKSLIDFALDHAGAHELEKLVPYVEDSSALLFSDIDAFEVSSILSDNKSPSKAKAGDISPFDIEIKAGPTDLVPGPDISALSAVGLTPKVENGKISIAKDKILVKSGDKINDKVASIMGKLNIVPFEVGIEPIAASMSGVVYNNIKVDKEIISNELVESYSRALPFAVNINYPNPQTIDYILAKAALHEIVLDSLENKEEPKEEAN